MNAETPRGRDAEREGTQAQCQMQVELRESEVRTAEDALFHLLRDRPDLRAFVAVHRYRADTERSLSRAAALAGVSPERMKEILERHGVAARLGPASAAEAREKAAALHGWLNADSS